jgi:hypothetical protein
MQGRHGGRNGARRHRGRSRRHGAAERDPVARGCQSRCSATLVIDAARRVRRLHYGCAASEECTGHEFQVRRATPPWVARGGARQQVRQRCLCAGRLGAPLLSRPVPPCALIHDWGEMHAERAASVAAATRSLQDCLPSPDIARVNGWAEPCGASGRRCDAPRPLRAPELHEDPLWRARDSRTASLG